MFLQVIQSLFSSASGLLYLYTSTPAGQPVPRIIPTRRIVAPLLLVALCQALAAPIGYAALAHVNYITYTLAKSCKLVPVMLLHVTLFRRRYPLYKYAVVAAVTAGVAVFTLHSGKGGGKSRASSESGRTAWGMLLLGINLLFDGLTNSTQDWIVAEFRPYRGPQMMCANNMMSSALSGLYLVLSPWLVTTPLGEWFGMAEAVGAGGRGELGAALGFMARHPGVWKDVLGFAACGAVGQVFICKYISMFLSLRTSPCLSQPPCLASFLLPCSQTISSRKCWVERWRREKAFLIIGEKRDKETEYYVFAHAYTARMLTTALAASPKQQSTPSPTSAP